MVSNQLYVILHGHFYQPPREDPWTGEIDRQPSAWPAHDWNERINKECYAANAASRVLDNAGRIDALYNNYRYLSFNFGPTLMSWLKEKDPYTFHQIIQADIDSRADQNGHGNAIAQVYNHPIMPLCSDRDIVTQIEWGLRSFKSDFGRDAEGIWLAETAVNDRVADFLVRYGIRFIILSPTQAHEVRPFHSDRWHDVSHNNIDPSKPYLLKTPSGSLNVFFYYGHIATKLSFEHLLRSVDGLRGELLSLNDANKPVHLVHTATDGETYGHHEPFGDMCFSRLLWENETRKDFHFTNYARFLEIQPPQDEVRIKEGNDNLGTAWSCSHGVDRWRRDCGCSTGAQQGWNQKWREGFRAALDIVRDRVYETAEREGSRYLHDVWAARNDFIEVVLAGDSLSRRAATDAFFAKHARNPLSEDDRTFVLRLMEAMRCELLMYTSCGWFFAEISGIETVQDMKYAGKIFELVGELLPSDTRDRFLDTLASARSNIPDFQNGKWIFENFVEKYVYTESHAISEYLLDLMLTRSEIRTGERSLCYYWGLRIDDSQSFEKDDWHITKFRLTLENGMLFDESRYVAYVFRNGNSYRTFVKKFIDDSLMNYLDRIIEKDHPRTIVRDFQEWFSRSYTLHDVKYDVKERILEHIFRVRMAALHRKRPGEDIRIDEYLEIVSLYQELSVRIPEKDAVAIQELLNNYLLEEIEGITSREVLEYDFSGMVRVIQTAKKANLRIDYDDFLPIIRNYVLQRMNTAVLDRNVPELRNLERIIDFSNIAGIDFEKYEIQNLLYDTLHRVSESPDHAGFTQDLVDTLLRLAGKFNIAVYRFENRIKGKI
jgi:alpha-amylase/alpha-mannosidase (GH57 family)